MLTYHRTELGAERITHTVPQGREKVLEQEFISAFGIERILFLGRNRSLSRDDVRVLIQHLQAWIETGSLRKGQDDENDLEIPAA